MNPVAPVISVFDIPSMIERPAVIPPGQTAVVCDSTCYLPPELTSSAGIEIVSLYVTLAGEQRRETEIGDPTAFFERLRESDEGATTSQPSVGDFLDVYRPLAEAGREIVSIHISAGISGTCESARQARDRLIEEGADPERVHVLDSRSGGGGLGMVALAGAKSAADGSDAKGVIEAAERARAALRMWFALDTLEYLRKGGRIGAARAWMGSALQIKPILTLEEEITPVERVRTRRRAFERLQRYAEELQATGVDGWVVQHIRDSENAEKLAAHCRGLFGNDAVFVSEVGPVLGAHTGPGLLGVGGLPRAMVA
jgi:DegV family protein with EDD domain